MFSKKHGRQYAERKLCEMYNRLKPRVPDE